MATAASYERVSTRAQGQSGFSLGAQAKDAAAYAAHHGWSLPDHLRFRDGEDRHASGADWDLPALNAMLDAARRHEFELLLVPTVDRFARDMTKALVLEQQLRKHGVRVVYLSAPVDDTAEGRLLLRQLQSFAEFEREKIAFRTMRGRREKIERGLVLGSGPAPYGYRYIRAGERNRVVALEPDPQTAPIVQRIFSLALNCSAISIADQLNRDGITRPSPSRGKLPWRQYVVLRLLTNPTYCGRVLYGGGTGRARAMAVQEPSGTLLSVTVPALVSPSVWQDVQDATVRRHEVRAARKPGPDPFLLRGLLVCGHCNGALSTKWNRSTSGPYRQYHCARSRPFLSTRTGVVLCPMRDVRADELEAAVWNVVTSALADPRHFRAGIESARQQHKRAQAARADRLRIVDKEAGRVRARIGRIIDELLETPKGTQSYRALVDRQRDAERQLATLLGEQADVAGEVPEGLSKAAAQELERFATQAGKAIGQASLSARRELFERLRLRGTVRLDHNGARLGRSHRFDIKLAAVVDLSSEQAVSRQGWSSVHHDALFEHDWHGARLAITVRG